MASISVSFFSDSMRNSLGASNDGVDVVLFSEISDVLLVVDEDLDLEKHTGDISLEPFFCKGR